MKKSASWNLKFQLLFFRRLAMLLEGGLVLPKALDSMRITKGGDAKVLEAIISHVGRGMTLAMSIRECVDLKSDFILSLIEIGETGGALSQQLKRAADILDRRIKLKETLVRMCLYPLCVIFVGILVLALVVGLVVPKMAPALLAMKVPLPFIMRLSMSVGDFLSAWGLWVGIALVMLLFVFWKMRSFIVSRLFMALWFFPWVGPRLIRKSCAAMAFRILETLLHAGINITLAIQIASKAMKDTPWQKVFLDARDNLNSGKSLSTSLTVSSAVPLVAMDLIRVGEQSGRLNESLVMASEILEGEFDDFLKRALILLEPILLLILGLGVGLVAISVIGPVYSFTRQFSP